MELDLDLSQDTTRKLLWGALLGVLLLGLGILGRVQTPFEDGRPVVLTSDRYLAAMLAQRAAGEIARLTADARQLATVLDTANPDAIRAMSLAQRIYGGHRTGTAATVPARQALIAAAEVTARYAAGGASRDSAVNALNAALARVAALQSSLPAAPADTAAPDAAAAGPSVVNAPAEAAPYVVYGPLALR